MEGKGKRKLHVKEILTKLSFKYTKEKAGRGAAW